MGIVTGHRPGTSRVTGATRAASNQEYLFAKTGLFRENLVTLFSGEDGLRRHLESAGFKIGPGVDLKMK